MKYSEVIFTITVGEEWQKDVFISELADIGFDTFEDQKTGFAAYLPTANLDIQALETAVLNAPEGMELQYEVVDIKEENWNTLWESNFEPIVVADQCYVRATFHPEQPQYPYEIVIDPKMSFGTGHHQTTSMMLQYILENDFQGLSVLDMGCGTGILGFLTSLKGAKEVLAIDYDSICVDSVLENKLLNGISNVEAACGSYELIEGKTFDAIVANINRNILLEQFSAYSESLQAQGSLYISGFFEGDDLLQLQQKARSLGFEFIDHKELNNWCAAKFIKK